MNEQNFNWTERLLVEPVPAGDIFIGSDDAVMFMPDWPKPFYGRSLTELALKSRFRFWPFPSYVTLIQQACREYAKQVAAYLYRDGYVNFLHDEAIVWNHCMMMPDLAESALWLFPRVSRLDQIYKQGWGIPGLR